MEITRRGVPAAETKWLGMCRSCGSEATARQSEMTHITADRKDHTRRFSWEKCPVCGSGSESGYGGMLFYPESDSPL